jgi:hypothetical protein
VQYVFYYLDNWRYANGDEPESFFRERGVLWFDGPNVIAFSILENNSYYAFQVHPEYVDVASEVLGYLTQDRGVRKISYLEQQSHIDTALEELGFGEPVHVSNEYEYDLETEIHGELASGYQIKTVAEVGDPMVYGRAKGTVWSGPPMTPEAIELRVEIKCGAESYSNDTVYLVIKEEDQTCVAFAAAWLEPVSNVIGFEPVGAVADERQKGHCQALLKAVFERCAEKGYRRASIRTGTADPEAPANYLYQSLNPINVYRVMEREKAVG